MNGFGESINDTASLSCILNRKYSLAGFHRDDIVGRCLRFCLGNLYPSISRFPVGVLDDFPFLVGFVDFEPDVPFNLFNINKKAWSDKSINEESKSFLSLFDVVDHGDVFVKI